jgi:hypothetical protein
MCCDLFGCFNSPKLNKTFTGLGQGCGQKLSGLGVSLGHDDSGLLCLFSFFDKESGLFSFLLCNLFQFDGHGELAAEGQMRDGDVVEDQTKLFGALGQFTVDSGRNLLRKLRF